MSSTPTKAGLKAHLTTIHTEAGGVGGLLNLDVVVPADMPAMTLAMLDGDADAQRLFGQVTRTIADVHSAPRRSPKLCASCPRPVRQGDGFSIAVATPACFDPTQSIAFVICERCGLDKATVKMKAAQALQRFWPDLRDVSPTHAAGGRA